MYQLQIMSSLTGLRTMIEIEDNEFQTCTVAELKKLAMEKNGLEMELGSLRLLFGGKQLEDEKLLIDYKIMNHSSITSVMRVQGGF